MPDDNKASSAETEAPKPKVRRISNKAPRKVTENSPEKETTKKETAKPPTDGESTTENAASGKPEQKRSNRRRRGKGKPSGQISEQAREGESSEALESPAPDQAELAADSVKKNRPESPDKPPSNQRPPQPPRRKLDPDKVAKNAWKIYLAEVSEEGVALIADNDARELARRCFRLSEIFLEEEDRRN
jgi:hypothetical protein